MGDLDLQTPKHTLYMHTQTHTPVSFALRDVAAGGLRGSGAPRGIVDNWEELAVQLLSLRQQ